jgi:hypothetical protein
MSDNNRTPSLAEIIRLAMGKLERTLRVGLPGKIEKFDPVTQLADVKPLLKEIAFDEEGNELIEALPVVTNVPVFFAGGSGFASTFPIAVGDTCWLGFSDRSLDQWISRGNDTDPIDLRRHELSDAVCWVGIRPNPGKLTEFDAARAVFGNKGPRVAVDGTTVHLGVAHGETASQSIVRGDAYRAAEDAFFVSLGTALTGTAAALTAGVTALAGVAAALAVTDPGVVPSVAAISAAFTSAAAALTPVSVALTQFTGTAATHLQPKVKTP